MAAYLVPCFLRACSPHSRLNHRFRTLSEGNHTIPFLKTFQLLLIFFLRTKSKGLSCSSPRDFPDLLSHPPLHCSQCCPPTPAYTYFTPAGNARLQSATWGASALLLSAEMSPHQRHQATQTSTCYSVLNLLYMLLALITTWQWIFKCFLPVFPTRMQIHQCCILST